jgi:hypothetical protein
MVIDGAVTLTGSMNWTRGAAVNSEDLNLISSPAVAAACAAHWHKHPRCLRAVRPPRGLVPGDVCGSALMRQSRSSRSPPAQRLCKVTIFDPEGYAEGIRQFAQELCARHQAEPTPTRPEWQALSPSAELMVSPERSARCAVRDTRRLVQTDFVGPSRCWDSWTRLPKGGLRAEQRRAY